MQPAPGRNAVCHIGELVRAIYLHKVFENGGFDQVGVQLGHTIDLVRAHNSQKRHPHHLGLRFLDNRHPSKHVAIIGECLLNLLQEEEIDIVDDLEVPGKKLLDEANRPLLQSLR